MRRGRAAAVCIALLAGLLWLVYGSGYIDYDVSYSLIWGRDIAHGRAPDIAAAHAPTPHPLANMLGTVLSPLGGGAIPVIRVIGVISLAALAYAAYRLGRALVSSGAGVLFAAVLLTRQLLVERALLQSIDIPWLALVAGAAALEAERPRRGTAVMVLLGVAGLIRPETWLLAIAYAVWLGWRAAGRQRVRLAALALIGPIVWMGFDLVATGDPLLSLHHTSGAAERLGRTRGLGSAITHAPRFLASVLDKIALVAAAAGAVIVTAALRARAAMPWAVLGLGGIAFLVLGATDQPLLPRYLLLPGAMLAFFAAAAPFAWRRLERPWRVRGMVAGLAVGIALLASFAHQRPHLVAASDYAQRQHERDDGLRSLLERRGVKGFLDRCPPIQVTYYRFGPLAAYLIDRQASAVTSVTGSLARSGSLLTRSTSGRQRPPTGFRIAYRSKPWVLAARCAR